MAKVNVVRELQSATGGEIAPAFWADVVTVRAG